VEADAQLNLPLSLVRDQLAKGVIKLSFSQFREFSPAGVFAPSQNSNLDVEIPLSEIVPKIKPDQLGRRANQRKVEVPEEIAPLFNVDGRPVEGVKISEEKPKAAAPAFPKPAAPPLAQTPVAFTAPPKEELLAPVLTPSAAAPSAAAGMATLPFPTAVAPQPSLPAVESLDTAPIRAPRLDPSLASLKPKAVGPSDFKIAFMDLVSFWTDSGKQELANLYRHSAEIPRERIEKELRRGKISFQWREFKQWIKLAPGNSLATLAEDYVVDLPLPLIASRFLEERTQGKAQKKALPADDIPDVFNKKSVPLIPASSPVEEPAPTEVSRLVEAPSDEPLPVNRLAEPVVVAPAANAEVTESVRPTLGAVLNYGLIFGQPDKESWSFSEVTEKCSTLRGVAGALIADSDGLLVSGKWGGNVEPDSVAAFVPQIYRRFREYATELQLGEGENFTLMIENIPFQVFKSGSNFLAILGKPGEVLPKPQLSAVAKCLAQTGK